MEIPGLNLIGSAVSALAGYFGQKETNATNIQLGREQMDFQERMSNTSYQRAIQDMQKAGLNPMLAYSQGGASAPAGSMPQIQNAVGAGMSSAAQAMQTLQGAASIKQSEAQTENIKAATEKIQSETMEKDLNSAMLTSQIGQIQTGTKRTEIDAETAKLLQDWQVMKQQFSAMRAQMEYRADAATPDTPDMKGTTFAADSARRRAESEISQLGIAPAKAASKFAESEIGIGSPYLRELLNVIRGITSAGAAHRAGR